MTTTPQKYALILIILKLGNLVGCLLAACYGDRLGRKNTLRFGAMISALGAVLQFSAYSFPQLIVGRVINGVGNGLFNLVAPKVSSSF